MKRVFAQSKLLLLIAVLVVGFSSCKKDAVQYQVRVQNNMYTEFLGYPFMKYDVVEFKIGGQVISEIPYSSYEGYSDYVTVESGNDYELSVTVEMFTYNMDNFNWVSSGTETFNLGTESWRDGEDYKKFKLKLEIGDILQLYKPVYTVYAEE